MHRAVAILKVDAGLERHHQSAVTQLILREPALRESDSRAGAGQVDRQTGDVRAVAELAAYLPGYAGGLEPGSPSGISGNTRSPAYVDQIFIAKRGRVIPKEVMLGGERGRAHDGDAIANDRHGHKLGVDVLPV